MRLIDRVWFGESELDRAARTLLSPFELLYRGIVGVRGELYDRGLLSVKKAAIPIVSIGNVAVGGTGKTPVAAWLAQKLLNAGRLPAIVLRGYGDDEPHVHARMNPQIPVIVTADRVEGIARAIDGGANIVVLDDAFQHRRAARDVDIVLMSADNFSETTRVLPAGPYRESLTALERATVIIITRKAASDADVERVTQIAKRYSRGKPVAVARLYLDQIIRETGPNTVADVSVLQGKSVLAIAAIGNPNAFFAQLDCAGATVTRRSFADHHAFTREEGAALAAEAARHDYAVCTLKDAVKLRVLWPAAARALWYVSLAVTIEQGRPELDRILNGLFKPNGN